MKKKKKQQRQSTSELTNRFQFFRITEEGNILYNQAPFKPEELLQPYISGRRSDPSHWQKLQDKILNLRDSLQSTSKEITSCLLLN